MFETGASEIPDEVPERKNNFSAVLLHCETIQMMVAEQRRFVQCNLPLTFRYANGSQKKMAKEFPVAIAVTSKGG